MLIACHDRAEFFRNLIVQKSKLGGAKKGHTLLKKKSDALSMRFRSLVKELMNVSSQWGIHLAFITSLSLSPCFSTSRFTKRKLLKSFAEQTGDERTNENCGLLPCRGEIRRRRCEVRAREIEREGDKLYQHTVCYFLKAEHLFILIRQFIHHAIELVKTERW
jgi:hypothetical protein